MPEFENLNGPEITKEDVTKAIEGAVWSKQTEELKAEMIQALDEQGING